MKRPPIIYLRCDGCRTKWKVRRLVTARSCPLCGSQSFMFGGES